MNTRYITAIAAAALMLCGCQRESLAPEFGTQYDGKVSYAPSVAGIVNGGGVRSGLSDGSAVIGSGSLTLRSADGRFTIPMGLSVTSLDAAGVTSGARTRALINENGSVSAKLDEFASDIDNTFWVAAWDKPTTGDPTQCIPDTAARKFTGGYVSGNGDDGYYQKVMYRDSTVHGNYWMTVQPQTAAAFAATLPDADDEYIWKENPKSKGEGVTKMFYAYANLPASAEVVLQEEGAGQTMSGSGRPDKDVLMGYYEGEGSGTGTATIQFHHPFAAVRFVEGTLADGVEITGIEVRKVYTGAWYVEQVEHGFTWTKDGTNVITADDAKDGILPIGWNSEQHASGDALVIPQSSPALACISITINDEPLTVYTEIGGWSAGTLYTYTIGYSLSGLHVTLKGDFSASEIKDVACYNDGGINAFVRAMVVANWVDEAGNVLETCDWTTEGTRVLEDGSLWEKCDDGFYYYKKGIKAGSTTKTRLIKSYKPATAPTGADGLEFNVYMQGIRYDELAKVKEQWPDLPEGVVKELEQ